MTFFAVFALVCTLIVRISPAHHRTTNPTACFQTFVHSMETESATGVWACLSDDMHKGYFTNGWQGDKDLQANLFQSFIAMKVTFQVLVYKGNPISVCAPNPAGQNVCVNKYLLHYKLLNADGTTYEDCSSFSGCAAVSGTYAITLDHHGLISNIERA